MAALIHRHIATLEARIRDSRDLSDEQRTALLAHLAELKAEAASVPRGEEHPLPVESSVEEKGPLTALVNELSAEIDSLEASHPRLTELTNRIALALANMGI